MDNFVQFAPNATQLDSSFFEQTAEQHPGSVFGYPQSFDENPEGQDPQSFTGWYRTNSGRPATVILEAEDGEESVGLLHFVTGESEIRRSQSFKPCLFGPPSDDTEDFDSDVDEDDLTSEVDTDTEEEIDENELPDTLGDDDFPELPNISKVQYRRNRGCSWYKMNSLGEVFETNNSSAEKKTENRMTMDAFGNFVMAGTQNSSDLYLEHLQMVQKRHPGVRNMKRSPSVSVMILEMSDSNLQE